MAVVDFLSKKKLRRAKAIERGLKMVPVLIHLPPPSSDTQGANRDVREVMREKTAQAEVLYNLLAGTATEGFQSKFYGQRHVAFELVASGGLVHFYAAVPVALVSVVKKAVLTAYPGARLEEVEDHNIFNQEGRLAATMGGEMVLRAESAYPIATYEKLERDPMEALLTTLTSLGPKDGVALQLMVRPAATAWTKKSVALADAKRKGRAHNLSFSAQDLVKAAVKAPDARREEERARTGGPDISNLELNIIEQVEEKTKHPGFEILIRVVVSTESVAHSQQMLRDISTAFALFDAPGSNGFRFLPALDVQGLVTAFIFRFFPPELASNVLNSVELATLFHLPDSQFTPSTSVERQQSKQVDGPVQLPTVGLLFGYNEFRGVRKEIRLSVEDRRRHTYILGQTGTGKSTMLENLAVQDMVNGNGFAFIDPHGDSAEKLLAMVPKERAEDVIYFNPADTEYPLGLNLFEFNDPTQKDFIVQETINMLYKLYDPGHTGIIGPRYEHWYRNAALTLMSDPNGSTFIEIPKVFTDTEYLKKKFRYLRDPTVIDFWTKEMGQTSDYHKSEMLGWFVSKFGAFQNNEMMRNIIGQTKSSFNLRDVMDNKKILIVNLSKGRVGELNSQLLGMIFVIKFQAAAMSRAETPEEQRSDFCLYVDEFQNFSTDSFASILSEARKYRLNLVVANQFIGQLRPEVRDAVFGNIGTIVAHRTGPEDAEFMQKQFAPVFEVSDLVNLPNFNAAMRLMIGGLPSQPFSLKDSSPLGKPNLELGLAVKQLSAAKFGRAKAAVEAEILDRLAGREAAPAAPAPSAVPSGGGAGAMPGMAAMAGAMGAPMAVPATQPVPPVGAAAAPAGVGAPAPTEAPSPASAPLSPLAAPPAPQTALQGMATAPPPIGAPPIGAPPITVADGAGAPMANSAGQPMSAPGAIIPEDNIDAAADQVVAEGGFSPLGAPAAPVAPPPAQSAGPQNPLASQPAGGPAGAMAPPPIGAPPVDLPPPGGAPAAPPPVAPPVQAAAPVQTAPVQAVPAAAAVAPPVAAPGAKDPGTLTVSDITGGRPLPTAVNPADVELVPPGAVPPPPRAPSAAMQSGAIPRPIAPQAPAAVPQVELGSGQALEGDPYANIEVLGDLTPPGQVQLQSEAGVEAEATAPTGQPLPNDPYANIDVLGAEPEAPAQADQAAAVLEEEPVDAEAVQDLGPMGAEAAAEPAVGAEAEAVLPEEQEPMAEPVSAEELEPAAGLEPEPALPTTTPPAAPTAAPPPPAPAAMPPEPVAAAQALPAAEPPAEPVPPELPADEPMIHFVDPAAQKVLDQPAPTATTVDDLQSQLAAGLPEGVTFVEQSAAVPPAAGVAPPTATVAGPVAAPAPAPSASAPAPPAPAAPPVVMGGPGVPALATQLDKMAVAPPPIGAPPVAAPPAPAPPPPAPVVPPPTAPPEPAAPVIPADNLSLAEALEKLPETGQSLAPAQVQTTAARPPVQPPVPAPVTPVATPPSDQAVAGLESVAEMLEEAKAQPAATPTAAQPPVQPADKSKGLPPGPDDTKSAAAAPQAPSPAPQAPASEPTSKAGASVPAPAEAKPIEQPRPAPSAAPPPVTDQIEKAESEIDKVVSSSLIREDTVSGHHRLPEQAAPPQSGEDESGIDLEMNSGRPTTPAPVPAADEDHAAEHHGLKVIQPLEPIVPPKEQFARELAAMNQAEQVVAPAQPAAKGKAAPVAAAASPPAPAAAPPAPAAAVPPPAQAPAAAPTAAAAVEVPKLPQQPAPAEIVKHAGAMMGMPPAPQVEGVAPADDMGMPQAESLAADDVARARAEHEAEQKLHVASEAAAPAAAEASKAAGASQAMPPAREAQAAAPPAASDKRAQPAVMPETSGSKRKRRRHGREKQEKQPEVKHQENAPEQVASAAEAEHNKPTAAEAEASSLTGKVIMPTGEKPAPAPVQPKLEKPKKLAAGEVFVDEHGNVMVGE